MQGLRYLDSTGVNALLDGHRSLSRENRRMVLVGASAMVRRILSVLSIEKMMPLFSTVEEALRYMRAPGAEEQSSTQRKSIS
jgi:anti-anti-sigma factor